MAAENAKEQPKPSGGESPINSAPPVPGQGTTPVGQEQPIQPAPAVPTAGTQPTDAAPQERAIGPAPTIPVSGSQEQQIAGPGVIPTSRPLGGSTGGQPIAGAPQVPVSGTQQSQPAGPTSMAGQPTTAGQMPMAGQPQIPSPASPAGPVPSAIPQQPGIIGGETPIAQAPTAGAPTASQTPLQPSQPGYAQSTFGAGQNYPTGGQGEIPMANPATMQGAGYPTPMAPTGPAGMPAPGWGQPPSNPPPVPPPNEPQAPHQQTGPVGNVAGQPQPSAVENVGTPGIPGEATKRSTRTRTARTLRRRSQERSSYFAMMFLFGAALFLIGVVIVLVVSLM